MQTEKATHSAEQSWIPASLNQTTVAIWGIGLMGGSLAMALHGKTAALFGIDPDERICRQGFWHAAF